MKFGVQFYKITVKMAPETFITVTKNDAHNTFTLNNYKKYQ